MRTVRLEACHQIHRDPRKMAPGTYRQSRSLFFPSDSQQQTTTKRVGTHISSDGRGFDAVWERTFRRALRLALGTHISCEGENAHFAGRTGVDAVWERTLCENLLKIYRKSIENLSKIYRKSIENLSKIYRKSIENLSKIYRTYIKSGKIRPKRGLYAILAKNNRILRTKKKKSTYEHPFLVSNAIVTPFLRKRVELCGKKVQRN